MSHKLFQHFDIRISTIWGQIGTLGNFKFLIRYNLKLEVIQSLIIDLQHRDTQLWQPLN